MNIKLCYHTWPPLSLLPCVTRTRSLIHVCDPSTSIYSSIRASYNLSLSLPHTRSDTKHLYLYRDPYPRRPPPHAHHSSSSRPAAAPQRQSARRGQHAATETPLVPEYHFNHRISGEGARRWTAPQPDLATASTVDGQRSGYP